MNIMVVKWLGIWLVNHCISYFSWCRDKISDKSHLRRRGLFWLTVGRYPPLFWSYRGRGSWSLCIHSQETEGDEGSCSATVLRCVESGTQPVGWYHPHWMWVFPARLAHSKTSVTDTPRRLCPEWSYQFGHQYLPSQWQLLLTGMQLIVQVCTVVVMLKWRLF